MVPHDFVCGPRNDKQIMYIKNYKSQIDHGDTLAANQICNISANIAPFLIQDECRYPYNRALMKLCPDPHGTKQPRALLPERS